MLLYWNDAWELDETLCACDIHFIEWLRRKDIRNSSIFHMGTGAHHTVGIEVSNDEKNNMLTAVTACPEEYVRYMNYCIDHPKLAWSYKPIFTDIYCLDERQIPPLDVASLFHIGEFSNEIRGEGPGLTDLQVLEIVFSKIKPGGFLLLYANSIGFPKIQEQIEQWSKDRKIYRESDHFSIVVYRKADPD